MRCSNALIGFYSRYLFVGCIDLAKLLLATWSMERYAVNLITSNLSFDDMPLDREHMKSTILEFWREGVNGKRERIERSKLSCFSLVVSCVGRSSLFH